MKKKILLGIWGVILSVGTVIPAIAADTSPVAVIDAGEEHIIESKTVQLLWRKYDQPKEITLHFIDGNTDVPYLEIEDFVALYNGPID